MPTDVFLSRPTSLTSTQDEFCEALSRFMEERGFRPRTVGVTDFGNRAPLTTVRTLMLQCAGAVILGLAQIHVTTGVRKQGTVNASDVTDVDLPTAWNHLEAGIAFALDLPLLVIREATLSMEGIFDPGIGDHFVHHGELTPAWLQSEPFLQPFSEWARDVEGRAASCTNGD